MRKILIPLFIFLLSATSYGQSPWQPFIAIDAGFRVQSPVELKYQVDSIETGIGLVIQQTYFGESPENKLVFIIQCYDYPYNTVHSDSIDLHEEFFDATLEEAIASVDGELKYSGQLDLSGFPGRRWRIDYLNGQASLKTQALLVRNRFYTLQIASPADMEYSTIAATFLDSFQLLQ